MDEPMYVLPENVSRTLGRDAQRNNILACKTIGEIVKTTLGPRGMDKMLVDSAGGVTVTNDGVTILEEMEIEHPAAKMLVEVARTQEAEVGDGTTTAALLGAKLLENAERLLDKKIHPTVIVAGYRKASEKSLELLKELGVNVENREMLKQIAKTAMTGKGAEGSKEKLAELVVSAVDLVAQGKNVRVEDVKIEKVRGEIEDSELISGIVLAKERANDDMPSRIENAKILVVESALEIKNPEIETRISVTSPEQLDSFIRSEENYLKDLTARIAGVGANVVFCQKGIDDFAQNYLAKLGIYACRRVPKEDIERIARATGARIVSNLNEIQGVRLGNAKIVEEKKLGDDEFTFIEGCEKGNVASIVLHGSTEHVLDEIDRSVKDALGDVVSAVKSGKILPGGGAIEIELARRLRAYANTIGGREQLAIEEFAHSLESIPEALAENAGLDPIDFITELRKRHEQGLKNEGLNLFSNRIEDMIKAGIVEPLKVKTQAISSASEVAGMILRIDDVLISREKKVRDREGFTID